MGDLWQDALSELALNPEQIRNPQDGGPPGPRGIPRSRPRPPQFTHPFIR